MSVHLQVLFLPDNCQKNVSLPAKIPEPAKLMGYTYVRGLIGQFTPV